MYSFSRGVNSEDVFVPLAPKIKYSYG